MSLYSQLIPVQVFNVRIYPVIWNLHSPSPYLSDFLGGKRCKYLIPSPDTEHLAEHFVKGGLIDWYLDLRKVPYPSLDNDMNTRAYC
jgi:hypothetical protein